MTRRRDELAAGLRSVRRRIEAACLTVGRDPGEVTVIVVTKFFPASDVHLLHGLGVGHVGESRQQEASAKRAQCAALDLLWHFIGPLQSNKAAAVAATCDVVHSVDRGKLLGPLSAGAGRHPGGATVDVLVQVRLDPDIDQAAGRSGVPPSGARELARRVLDTEGLRLRGVMGVAPRGGDPRLAFALLRRTGEEIRSVDPTATWVSAGMSGDLEAALAAGATHVRIGSAILGNRPDRR